MRSVLLLLAMTACNHAPRDSADASVDLAATLCARDCNCDGGAICLPGGLTHAACLTPCRTSADCAAGLDCRLIDYAGNDLPPSSNPPVCVSQQLPAPCAPPNGFNCSDHGGSYCIDDTRLGTGFVWPENFTCGFAITVCANGCSSVDAGFFLASGHCR